MIAHLEAVKAHLAPLGYTVHILEAIGSDDTTTPLVPYLVLGAATFGRPQEMPVCDTSTDLGFPLRVTAVAATVDGPAKIQNRVRGLLSPGYGPTFVPMTARLVVVQYERTEVAGQVDRDVTTATTNRHPGWGVDTYMLRSQPA